MRLSRLGMILSTCCFLLAGCKTDREAVPLRPDLANPNRMICEGAPAERPAIPSYHSIDWSKVRSVDQARLEHEAYVRSVYARSGVLAAYIVEIEGKLFVCSNNAQWWRDYWAAMPDPVAR